MKEVADLHPLGETAPGAKKKRSRRRRKPKSAKTKNEVSEKCSGKKHHDAPMTKRDLYFVLHCELVSIGHDSSAVARVTLINWDGEVVLDTFVQVPVPVTDFRGTGIDPQLIASSNRQAMNFAKVRLTVHQILKGKILIGHNLHEHLTALGLSHPPSDIRDTARFQNFQYEEIDGITGERIVVERSLVDLSCEFLQQELESEILAPMEACNVSLQLYKKFREVWEAVLVQEASHKENRPIFVMASTASSVGLEFNSSRLRLNSFDPALSTYSDGVSSSRMVSSAQERSSYAFGDDGSATLQTGLTTDALELFSRTSQSSTQSFSYHASLNGFESSSNYGSHYEYEESILSDSYRTESIASSINDDTRLSPQQPIGKSSWFRFGSRKSKYSDQPAREPMTSLSEEPDTTWATVTPPAEREAYDGPLTNIGLPVEEGKSTSSSWFGFRRPKSPRPGKKNSDSDDERDHTPVKRRGSMGSFGLSGNLRVATRRDSLGKSSRQGDDIDPQLGIEKENSGSWFKFRRSSTKVSKRIILDKVEQVEADEQPSIETEHTVDADEDWLREVVGSPSSEKKDVLDSSWLYESASEPKSSNKESTWLPRFMRRNSSSGEKGEPSSANTFLKGQWNDDLGETAKQQMLNPSFFFEPVDKSANDSSFSFGSNGGDAASAARSRLETETTLPTVVSEEEVNGFSVDLSSSDFTINMQQNLAYLNI